jgi:hypothetical protein
MDAFISVPCTAYFSIAAFNLLQSDCIKIDTPIFFDNHRVRVDVLHTARKHPAEARSAAL